MDPQERGNWRRPESPPPGLEDATSKADELGDVHGDAAPGSGFLRDFASLDEFLAFARSEVASTEVPLPLVDSTLSAKEADLAAREEAVRANEKMQVAEDMILMGREVKVAEQEKDLARIADLEESERIHTTTIRELQDRIALDEDRLVQGLESVDRWTRGEIEAIL